MVKVNPSLPPRGGNARLLLECPEIVYPIPRSGSRIEASAKDAAAKSNFRCVYFRNVRLLSDGAGIEATLLSPRASLQSSEERVYLLRCRFPVFALRNCGVKAFGYYGVRVTMESATVNFI